MNIKEAKEQIKYAMTAYFEKDDLGNYEISPEKQRPVFLVGAPGIGKTAIMEQIAEELGVLLVSYSMTHHTRQSALGLPFIMDKNYAGDSYKITEYTMSEIIASVYDAMENTGLSEGILFLDEINCVSETLTPSMLQFLQFKSFGQHKLPNGWIVVTAGNPPEYNRSVREFDVVTLDRLKKIVVEPDFETWKEYAYKRHLHPSVMSYLEIKKGNFYKVETTAGDKSFVTARGWDDLSQMMKICEKKGLPVDIKLICQYIQNAKIASDFATYYDLFVKYKSDYQIESILCGNASDQIKSRAANSRFDERIAVLGLMLDSLSSEFGIISEQEKMIAMIYDTLKEIKNSAVSESLPSTITAMYDKLSLLEKTGAISTDFKRVYQRSIRFLEDNISAPNFNALKESFKAQAQLIQTDAETASNHLSNAFDFIDEVFPQGQEILIFVTELTVNEAASDFISHYGSKQYFEHNKDLMFYERNKEIVSKLEL